MSMYVCIAKPDIQTIHRCNHIFIFILYIYIITTFCMLLGRVQAYSFAAFTPLCRNKKTLKNTL